MLASLAWCLQYKKYKAATILINIRKEKGDYIMKTVFEYPDGTIFRIDQSIREEEYLNICSDLFDRHGGYPINAWEDGQEHPLIDRSYNFYGDHN